MEHEREQGRAAFNTWEYRHYFEFDAVKDGKNISVRCTLCVGNFFIYSKEFHFKSEQKKKNKYLKILKSN